MTMRTGRPGDPMSPAQVRRIEAAREIGRRMAMKNLSVEAVVHASSAFDDVERRRAVAQGYDEVADSKKLN